MGYELRQALIDAARLHRVAELASEGGTAGLTERVTGSKPGSSHLTFADDLPLSVELERFYRRAAEYWSRRVEGQDLPSAFRKDSRSPAKKEQTRAILAERGVDPTAVAFIHGSSTEAVRKLRGRNGFDPDTGLRETELRQERIDGEASRKTPLTAPARAAMDDLESRDEGGEHGEAS